MLLLQSEKYHLLQKPLKEVKINTLFARFVIEKKVDGKVFVDNTDNPSTFYIVHPYGMSLLFGKSNNEAFNEKFVQYALNKDKHRNSFEWMQASSEWNEKLQELFTNKLIKSNGVNTPNNCIELSTRVNFKFNQDNYLEFKKKSITEEYKIVRTDEKSFNNMRGTVIPSLFWNNASEFCKSGVGFSLFHEEKLATTAYSAFIFENELELGMETIPEFRGNGFAQYACSALIDYCITHDYEPIWACKLGNVPSYKLAQKLGFVPNLELPYYRLSI